MLDALKEAHCYMPRADYEALRVQANKDCRSVNGQILHYIKRGLEEDAYLAGRPKP